MNPIEHKFLSDGAMPSVRHALIALMVMGAAACGPSDDGTGPQVPGSISVTTETSGFLKDDSYDLLVDGASQGTIGANDQLTIADLDPATYELALGDVATNCVVDSASADVVSNGTAEVSLSVVCSPAEATEYTLRGSRDRPNLDDGSVIGCSFGICPSDADWDVWVDLIADPVVHHNETAAGAVEIAHITGASLTSLTEADYLAATFTTTHVDEPFDSAGRVVLIRTQLGAVYALGNPVLNAGFTPTLTFDAALLVAGP